MRGKAAGQQCTAACVVESCGGGRGGGVLWGVTCRLRKMADDIEPTSPAVMSDRPTDRPSVRPSVRVSVHPSVSVGPSPSVRRFVRQSVGPSVCQPVQRFAGYIIACDRMGRKGLEDYMRLKAMVNDIEAGLVQTRQVSNPRPKPLP